MPIPRSLVTELARIRSESEQKLLDHDNFDTVEWVDAEPVVFPLGRGYVAMISCVIGMTVTVDGQQAQLRSPGYNAAIKFGGSGQEWRGGALFIEQGSGLEEAKSRATELLGDLMNGLR